MEVDFQRYQNCLNDHRENENRKCKIMKHEEMFLKHTALKSKSIKMPLETKVTQHNEISQFSLRLIVVYSKMLF